MVALVPDLYDAQVSGKAKQNLLFDVQFACLHLSGHVKTIHLFHEYIRPKG